ncbi:hypothetical protein BLA29_011394 [Euroglyphus maynei]|uniref:Glucuronosyltransferase n=1 Tax=Euroglyphus maynei TaxID=6958 RepID=A0A1Y3BI99_EURMA|nr:hypothetical protein BLA29_011394 [Euroglyphus maynei]
MVMGSCQATVELPDNIWGDSMLPQLKILPMVDLVISHGGNNSVIESLYHGKPLIICPLFYDQYDNAQRVTEKGFGNRINPYKCKPEELLEMIERILNDRNINDRCRKISERMQKIDSPMEAAKAIIDVALEK